jgi:hypothetical protein
VAHCRCIVRFTLRQLNYQRDSHPYPMATRLLDHPRASSFVFLYWAIPNWTTSPPPAPCHTDTQPATKLTSTDFEKHLTSPTKKCDSTTLYALFEKHLTSPTKKCDSTTLYALFENRCMHFNAELGQSICKFHCVKLPKGFRINLDGMGVHTRFDQHQPNIYPPSRRKGMLNYTGRGFNTFIKKMSIHFVNFTNVSCC